MRKISIMLILELIFVNGMFAMRVNIEDVNLAENNISFFLNIDDINNEIYYFTNLHNPFYKIDEDILYIYFSQFGIPEEVCMDFPEIKGDEIVNNDICMKKRIFLDENNYIRFEEKPKIIEITKIKKIVFVFGYLEEYDKKVLNVGLEDSRKQREKFYYVVKIQKLLYREIVFAWKEWI